MEAYRDNVEHPTVIHRIFHDPSFSLFKTWHQIINFLIYLSCIAIAIETVDEIEAAYHHELAVFEWISVAFFTLDYLGNIFTSKDRLKYLTSFWGLVDLLSILPTYLMLFNFTGVKATKILRILRVIRVLRVLKLARSALQDVNDAKLGQVNPLAANLRIYFIALFSTLMISSTLIFYVEGGLYTADALAEGQTIMDQQLVKDGKAAGSEKFIPSDPISGNPLPEDKRFFTSIPASMWWCITTLTTTGYGDYYPSTVGGRIIGGATMLVGLVLFGILMNIVGRTLMIMLFGEADDREPHNSHAHAMDLFVKSGVINQKRADELNAMTNEQIRDLLERR